MTSPLQTTREGGTVTFTLHRADKRNALSAELVERLIDGVQEAHAQKARLLVFRGEGRNFSAGFDFGDVDTQSEGDLLLRFVRVEQLLQLVSGSPALTLSLAQGKNFGAGVDLFASCRRRVAAADSSFRMPGLKFGLVLGTRRLGDIVGRERAAALQQETSTFSAQDALGMSFIQQIAEPAEWGTLIAAAQVTAEALSDEARASLYSALSNTQADTDLATLVRSAAQPGLKARIAAYLG